MSELLLVFGGMVAGPGLLAAWEVFSERSESLKAKVDEPFTDEDVVEVTVADEPEAEEPVLMRPPPPASVSGKVASLGESFLDWEEDDEEEKTVLFALADILGPEDTESVLIDEK
jgi:hypothetical protein